MKLKRVISNNLLILKYYVKYVPGYFFSNIIFTIYVSAVWTITGPITTKFIFDALTKGKSFKQIMTFLVLVSCLMIIRHIYACIVVEYLGPIAKVTLQENTKQELFEKASKMDLQYYETPKFYNDFVWAASQSDSKIEQVYNTTLQFVARLSELLFMGGVMLALDPTLFLFAAFSIGIRIFFNKKIIKKRFELEKQAKPLERERDYSGRIFYLSDYAKEIRLSRIHESLFTRFQNSCKSIADIYTKGGKKLAFYAISSSVLQEVFSTFSMYVYLAYEILVNGALSFGDFGALTESTHRFSGRVRQLVDICVTFSEHSLYIEKFRDFLSYEPSIELKPGEKPAESVQPITFRNVTFTYSGETTPSLKNINLTIHPYEKIAIVGYNGAGKSTLIKLLLRLYDVSEGEILLGNTNIKEFETEAYRNQYGAVFQDYQIFAATLGENVAMNSTENEDTGLIAEALYKSNFSETLDQLALSLETPLTKEFQQDGINLSGGEGQKVALARVFYKSCNYAIMDEPSSALDPISEYKLNNNMMEIARDKTVIFISHRLSTTVMADRIYMLENGEIIEQGTHRELMELNEKYAEMFYKQAEKYNPPPISNRMLGSKDL
jgi:ATP-binding cassette subfamily B protein